MQINPYIFRGYDIRGVVGQDLNEKTVAAIGMAYAAFLRQRKIRQAVVGYDHRLSGPEFADIIARTLVSQGINVVNIGLAMSPVVYFAQYHLQTNGAVVITASHNPKEYNGFKLATGFSETMGREGIQALRSMIEKDEHNQGQTTGKKGAITSCDITEDYLNDVLKRVELGRKLKVVIDTGNGSAGAFVPEAVRRMGCDVVEQNTEVDGSFPNGTPDPTDQEMINRLSVRVVKENADIGIALDGDGDRLGVVDEQGRVLWNDTLIAIFAKDILERLPGAKIIYNTLCSQIVKSTIEENGGVPIMWLTGHSFIKKKVDIESAAFGGELSGHFFFTDNFYGHDDSCFAALRLLDYVSHSSKSLGAIYDDLPQYVSSPEIKLGCADDKKVGIIKDISKRFKDDWPAAEITDDIVIPNNDGARADFPDGMIIIRYSHNGPYLTIKFEARDKETYEKRRQYVCRTLEQYREVKWDDGSGVNVEALKQGS